MSTTPDELNDYIAAALKDVVPVKTGALRDSIEARNQGIWALDYYAEVMARPPYPAIEEAAIESATEAWIRDYEQDLDF